MRLVGTRLRTDIENASVVHEVRRRAYRQIAVISSEHEAMLLLSEAFRASVPGLIVVSFSTLPGESDFHSKIAKIKARQVDAVYRSFVFTNETPSCCNFGIICSNATTVLGLLS